MEIPRSIFKMYDIRGLIDGQLSEELAEAIGRGFVALLSKELPEQRLTIAVGRDMRETSPTFQAAVMKGITESGADVVDIGLVSTPAFYFGVGHTKASGGIMVSASHNPAEYNGFKLTRANALPVSGDTGIQELADIIEGEHFLSSEEVGTIRVEEGIPEKAVQAEIDLVGRPELPKMKIVVDTANGMGAQYFDILFNEYDFDVTRLFWELDGSFPNHEADPLKPENQKDLQAKMKEVGADLGIATDGDGDRIFFVDNNGELIEPAIARGVLSAQVLKQHPGAKIGFDVRPGRITEDLIRENGGEPFKTRVGHSLIKEKMIENNSPFSGESSGHFFYRYETGSYEGPASAAVSFIQAVAESGKTVAEFVEPLKRYAHSGEINFVVEDKQATMEKIKEVFADGELNEMDGILIEYPDFWFNVRASNTEPKLRLNLEAVDQATMEAKRDEVIKIIEG